MTTTTLDPSTINNFAGTGSLSGGNLTLSSTGVSAAVSTSAATGKQTWQVTVSANPGAIGGIVGFASDSTISDGFTFGWSGSAYQLYDPAGSPFATGASSPAPSNGMVLTFDPDPSGKTISVRVNGTAVFTGQNVSANAPATWKALVLAADASIVGTTFTSTVAFSGLTYPPLSGYSEWDASGATNYTLTAAQGSFSFTGYDVTKPTGLVSKVTYGGEGDGVTTATIPAHNVGDLLLAWAFRDGSTTLPTLPAGWNSILTKTGTTCCARLAYKIATSTSDSSGTWTSATELIIQVYPGVDRVGASASNSGSSTSVNYPALTFQSDKAWVAGFAGHRSTNTSLETPPTGMTNRADHTDATAEAAGHDTNGTVTNWASTNVAVGGTSSGWVSATVELIPTYSGVPAAGYTLTAAQGSFALTGEAAGLKVGRVLGAAQGSFALTGESAGLRRGYTLSASRASFTMTGEAAALRIARSLAAAQGSFGLTGEAANLIYGRVLTAGQGSFSLTGENAGLAYGRVLGTAQRSFALTGQLVTLRYGRITLTASYGSFGLTGEDANLRVGRSISAAQGAFTLTGESAGLAYGRVLSSSQGSFALTGEDVTLTYTPAAAAYTLTVDYGEFALTGEYVGIAASRHISAEQAAFSLTGESASLKADRQITVDNGAFALTGEPVGLTYSQVRSLTAEAGIFALTGQTASLISKRELAASVGSIVLTGESANLERARLIAASSGLFGLTGEIANLAASRKLALDAAELSLDGQDVELVKSQKILSASFGVFQISGLTAGLIYYTTNPPRVDKSNRNVPHFGGDKRPSPFSFGNRNTADSHEYRLSSGQTGRRSNMATMDRR